MTAEEVNNAIEFAKEHGFYVENRWKSVPQKVRELYSKDGVIAIPLCTHGRAFGSLSARFIDSAVERSEIETSILPKMREIGKKIESEWEQSSAVHATDSTSHP